MPTCPNCEHTWGMVECHHCGYVWEYTGDKEYTSCPDCLYKINVEQCEISEEKDIELFGW